MLCIKCYSPTTQVTNSRPHKKTSSVWRRRACKRCGYVFTTSELPSSESELTVWNIQHKTNKPFSLSTLTVSIANSFTHNQPSGNASALSLATTIMTRLMTESTHGTISSDDIAAHTYDTLRHFDEVAAMQYGVKHGLLRLSGRRSSPQL